MTVRLKPDSTDDAEVRRGRLQPALLLVAPDEGRRLNRRRCETEDEHQKGEGREPQPASIERNLLVDNARMPRSEEQQHADGEDGPYNPRRRHEREADQAG